MPGTTLLDHEEEYELSMDVAGMEPGQIWWDSTNITRIDVGEPMELSLASKRTGQERKERDKADSVMIASL